MAVGLMHSRNLVDVLDSILHYACRLVAAPNGFVYMESADPNLLEIKVGLGIFEQHVGYKIGKGDGLAGKVWSSGKPIIIENYYQSLEWDKDSQGKGTQTAIGIPLQSQGKVVGVIGLDMFGQARSFSQEDFIAFERLAELASIAVGNAYLAETLDRELEERKETEEQLIYLNNHDAMTGVFNRSFFEIVQSQVEEAGNVPVALFICDVDNLKLINDQYGHQAGDVILKATASILTAIAPPGAVVSRIGGDEFAMIIPGIDKAELIEIRENIRQRTENYSKNESAIPLSMSVGYAIAEKGPISMEQLFQIADDGMYRQKPGQVENIRQVIMNNLVNTKNLPDNTK
jgi:diguanylate cyclase (GGDEF)-like protein